MSFNPRLPVTTRRGLKVEILAVLPPDKISKYSEGIVALVHDDDGNREIHNYRSDGTFDVFNGVPSVLDLVNMVPRVLRPTPAQSAAMVTREHAQYVAQTASRILAVIDNKQEPA